MAEEEQDQEHQETLDAFSERAPDAPNNKSLADVLRVEESLAMS